MASLKHLVRHAAIRNFAGNNLLLQSPTIPTSYSDYLMNTAESVDLSSVMYSPELTRRSFLRANNTPTEEAAKTLSARSASYCREHVTSCKTLNSLCHESLFSEGISARARSVSKINSPASIRPVSGRQRSAISRNVSPLSSTLNQNECVKRLNFNSIGKDKQLGSFPICLSSTGYSSNSSSSLHRYNQPSVPPPSPILNDTRVFEAQFLDERPECIGKEASPKATSNNDRKKNSHVQYKALSSKEMSVISIDSDTSAFVRLPLFHHALSTARSKASFRFLVRKIRHFKKQFRHFGKRASIALSHQ